MEERLDAGAFWSASLGFGNLNKDKLETFKVGGRQRLNSAELFFLYETNNFVANVIDAVPDAATQKWCKYESDTDSKNIQTELDRIKPYINQGWKLARLVGWAAVVMLINDTEKDYSVPVNTRNIRGISGYTVVSGGDAGEISVTQYDENPFSPTYGQPEIFTIGGNATPVHISRLLLFYGVKRLASLQGRSRSQLGTSVVDRCYQEFRNFDVGNNAIASTLPDFNVDVFAIPGLMKLLAKQKDFASYISGMAFARSVLKVQLVEAGEGGQNAGGYQIINRQYTGVKEMLEYFKNLFAGATDLSHTQLFGESPSGQTSGKYQMRSWSQYIANQQQTNLRPELEKLINYCHVLSGGVPADWSIDFPPILELDETEEADIELKQAQALGILTDKQIATPDEVATALASGIKIGKAIDLEAREVERQALQTFPEGMATVNTNNTNM